MTNLVPVVAARIQSSHEVSDHGGHQPLFRPAIWAVRPSFSEKVGCAFAYACMLENGSAVTNPFLAHQSLVSPHAERIHLFRPRRKRALGTSRVGGKRIALEPLDVRMKYWD